MFTIYKDWIILYCTVQIHVDKCIQINTHIKYWQSIHKMFITSVINMCYLSNNYNMPLLFPISLVLGSTSIRVGGLENVPCCDVHTWCANHGMQVFRQKHCGSSGITSIKQVNRVTLRWKDLICYPLIELLIPSILKPSGHIAPTKTEKSPGPTLLDFPAIGIAPGHNTRMHPGCSAPGPRAADPLLPGPWAAPESRSNISILLCKTRV